MVFVPNFTVRLCEDFNAWKFLRLWLFPWRQIGHSWSLVLNRFLVFQYLGWNISPFLVTFLEGKLKISFLMPSLLTLLNFKLDLEWKFTKLFLWMLPLFWMIFIIVSRFSLVSILVGLSFKWVVMFVTLFHCILQALYCSYLDYC